MRRRRSKMTRLTVRVGEELRAWLEEAGRRHGVGVGKLVRACIARAMRELAAPEPEPEDAEAFAEWERLEPRERRRLGNG